MANWKENIDTQEEGIIFLREEGKGEAIFETTKDFGYYFLRNVEIIVLVEVYGANYVKANWAKWAKANWANCFCRCIVCML